MIEISRSELSRIVVSIDPAVTSGENADDTGLIVVGRGPCQPSTCKLDRTICTGHGYVLADLTCHVAPREWARRGVDAFHEWGADRIVGEVNNGGDMIGDAIHAADPGVSYRQVRATRGKQLRAEPASALYEQGRVHHLGIFKDLEDQQQTWTLDARWSPDRLDALVWGLVELGLIGAQGAAFLAVWEQELEDRRGRQEATPYHGGLLQLGCQHRFRTNAEGLERCVFCQGVREQPVAAQT